MSLLGLHHVTAVAGNARRNLDAYGSLPGMRMVKRTVNFDDPGSYHLYFGGGQGTPGTLLTFFPWANAAFPNGRRGTRGSGQISQVTMRMADAGSFADPDGIAIRVAPGDAPWLESATLCEANATPTVDFLRDVLGLKQAESGKKGTARLALADGAWIDVEHAPNVPRGKNGAGILHHVAFRVADENAQLAWRDKLAAAGV